jgi:hypothetical protein
MTELAKYDAARRAKGWLDNLELRKRGHRSPHEASQLRGV